MELIVDRIEAGFAVCETPDRTPQCISLDSLPDGVGAGSVLREEGGAFVLLEAETEARRAALFALQQALFDEADEAPPANA